MTMNCFCCTLYCTIISPHALQKFYPYDDWGAGTCTNVPPWLRHWSCTSIGWQQ